MVDQLQRMFTILSYPHIRRVIIEGITPPVVFFSNIFPYTRRYYSSVNIPHDHMVF